MLTAKEIQEVQKSLQEGAERLPFLFDALADATRLKIFKLLLRYNNLCVTDLANILKISVPGISYQLKLMEMAGLIERERMGQMVCYKLKKDDPLVKKVSNIVDEKG